MSENEDDASFRYLYYHHVLSPCHQSPLDGCAGTLLLHANRNVAIGMLNLVYQICDWQALLKAFSVSDTLSGFQNSYGDFMFKINISRVFREAHCHG